MMAAADALTILEQIEGAMAYMDTIGTKAEDQAYKRMRIGTWTEEKPGNSIRQVPVRMNTMNSDRMVASMSLTCQWNLSLELPCLWQFPHWR